MPEQAEVFWYGMRMWIEYECTLTKRAGWNWHRTRMTDPERAARLWFALAVATLWVVSVGGDAEEHLPASSFHELPDTHVARQNAKSATPAPARVLSCFRRGILVILTTLIAGQPLPLGQFWPEAWPSSPPEFFSYGETSLNSPKIEEMKTHEGKNLPL